MRCDVDQLRNPRLARRAKRRNVFLTRLRIE
jgi:hypothetical protein